MRDTTFAKVNVRRAEGVMKTLILLVIGRNILIAPGSRFPTH